MTTQSTCHSPRSSERVVQTVLEHTAIILARFDRQLHFVYVSPGVEAAIGLPPERVVGKTCREIGVLTHLTDHWEDALRQVFDTGQPTDIESCSCAPDGAQRTYDSHMVPEFGDDGSVQYVVGICCDVSRRRQVDKVFRTLADNSPQALSIVQDGQFVFANATALEWSGLTEDEMYALPYEQLMAPIHPEDRPQIASIVADCAAGGPASTSHEFRFVGRDGEVRWNAALVSHITYKGRPALQISYHDITGHKKVEEQLRRTNRALRLVSSCNQALMRAEDEAELLREVCRLVVEDGGHRMAWVGFAEQDEAKSVIPAAHAGHEEGYLTAIRPTWAAIDDRGRGPVGRAICTGAPAVVRDIASEPGFRWRAEAARRGYVSAIGLPLIVEGAVIGVLAIYTADPEAFDAPEAELLMEMAGDLAFGISVLRTRVERERATAELRQQKEILQTIVDNAPVMVEFLEPDGSVGWVNRTWERTLGWTLEEARSRNILAEEYPDESDYRHVRDTIARADRNWEDFKTRCRDGTLLDTSWANAKLSDGSRIGIGQDITKRKRAESQRDASLEALRESEERYRTFIDSTTDLAFLKDDELRYVIVNKANQEFFGKSEADVVGKTDFDLMPQESAAACHSSDRQAIEQGGIVNSREQVGDRIYETRKFPVRLRNGKTGVGAFIRDVTERVRAEEAHERVQAQLLQAQKMEAVGRLTAGIAHDFNNMLTAILGFAELMQMQVLPNDPLRVNLERILFSGRAAASLVQQLTAFSRQQVMQPRLLDVNTVITRMESMLRRVIGEDITLVIQLAAGSSPVKVDPGQLQQVIVNLVVNARDAMPDGGRLTVTTANVTLSEDDVAGEVGARPGDYVELTVVDTGSGMSTQVLEHIFEPFFTTKPAGKGTGLGLPTAYGIVEQSGGHITVESQTGRGTTFRVYLPRSPESEQASVVTEPEGALPLGTETILVVDDNHDVRTLGRHVLSGLGYVVLEADNGSRALTIAAAHAGAIHLLLTDVVMPGMSGREVAEQLLVARPDLRVLYASGYDDDVVATHGLLRVGQAFLSKPYSPADLAQKVRQVLDAPPGA